MWLRACVRVCARVCTRDRMLYRMNTPRQTVSYFSFRYRNADVLGQNRTCFLQIEPIARNININIYIYACMYTICYES